MFNMDYYVIGNIIYLHSNPSLYLYRIKVSKKEKYLNMEMPFLPDPILRYLEVQVLLMSILTFPESFKTEMGMHFGRHHNKDSPMSGLINCSLLSHVL